MERKTNIINLMKQKNNLIMAGVVVIALIIIAVVGVLSPRKTVQEPAITETNISPKDNPPVTYDTEQTKKMIRILKERPVLSSSDMAIRDRLKSYENPVKITGDYSIEYLSAPNEFQVEIRTVDIVNAKTGALNWFKAQGLSTEGICRLPVIFYINYDIANQLRSLNIIFDPLPPGC